MNRRVRLSGPQQAAMSVFYHRHWLYSPEQDGSWLPPDRMHKTMDALGRKGLLREVSAGRDGFKYSGWALNEQT